MLKSGPQASFVFLRQESIRAALPGAADVLCKQGCSAQRGLGSTATWLCVGAAGSGSSLFIMGWFANIASSLGAG